MCRVRIAVFWISNMIAEYWFSISGKLYGMNPGARIHTIREKILIGVYFLFVQEMSENVSNDNDQLSKRALRLCMVVWASRCFYLHFHSSSSPPHRPQTQPNYILALMLTSLVHTDLTSKSSFQSTIHHIIMRKKTTIMNKIIINLN